MLLGGIVPAAAEDGDTATTVAGSGVGLNEASDLSYISYDDYLSKYPDAERASKGFTFSALDYDEEETTDPSVRVETFAGEKGLITSGEGSVTWKFTVPESGLYTFSVRFYPTSAAEVAGDAATDSDATSPLNASIERVMYLNGKVPYLETRYVAIDKTWNVVYENTPGLGLEGREGIFKMNGTDETRPLVACDLVWHDHTAKDSDGFYTTPFEYYLEEGENTLTLENIRDSMAISSFTFAPYEPLKTYEETVAEYIAKGYEEAATDETVYINAEAPTSVSNYTVYPVSDNSSAITEPQHASHIIRNAIGGEKWQTNGQWLRYDFDVPVSGLYTINPRFKQSLQEGIFVSREVRIDGEIPFEEASSIRFNYGKDWQIGPLSDDDGTPFQFYLEAGHHTIDFEVVLGDMAVILQQADEISSSINSDYLEITKLTGKEADENRSYGFGRIMPNTIADLSIQSRNLKSITRMISATSGIKSDKTGTLTTMAEVLRKMGSNENRIASNLSSLQEQISSLGEWVSTMSAQPLSFDYILIQPASAELPKAEGNFLENFWFEISKFFASFFSNYDAIVDEEEAGYTSELLVWTSSGREQAQIINTLIKNGFSAEHNVSVTLKLVTGGTLVPAILAGTAPDVNIDASSPIDMAIRGAVLPLNEFDTIDEVVSRFADSAMVPLQLYGQIYAIPTTWNFNVMFYRTDILADLGLSVPKTWDEVMAMVPVLQFNNMDVGISGDIMNTLLYQYGGSYWKEDGMRCNFDSAESLDAFETLCNFYTQYSLPHNFNGLNRMKTGEMPIIVTGFPMYNTLTVSAPEISGLWKFTECPGVVKVDENGEEYIDNRTVAAASGIMMPKTARDKELAWDFIDWFTDKDYQIDFSNEMVALLGPSAKQNVANLEAFDELPWSTEEKNTLHKALDNSFGIEAYPGDYIVLRYLNFAFDNSYSQGMDPSDMLLEYTQSINKELSRKRKEFGLMIAEEWDVVKAYMEYDDVSEWNEYRDANGIEDYKAWMKEQGISEDNYESWEKEVRHGTTTLSYRDWIAQN